MNNFSKDDIQKMINDIIDDRLQDFKENELDFKRWDKLDGVTDQFSPITGSSTMIGFYGTPKISKPTITGAKGGNAALTSVCSVLSALGLATNSTT